MKRKHFPICQPKLKKGESGCLLKGKAPEKNVEKWVSDVQLIRDQEILARPASLKSAPTKMNGDDTVTSDDEMPENDS